MKKIFIMLGASSFAFGQQLLFQQNQLDAQNFMNVISSAEFGQSSNAIYIADDFILPQRSTLSKIKFFGQIDSGFLDIGGINSWTIYTSEDNAGKPKAYPNIVGTSVMNIINVGATDQRVTLVNDSATPNVISVEIDVTGLWTNKYVQNTRYWISVFSQVGGNGSIMNRKNFYWGASTLNTPNLLKAKVLDPMNHLGNGFTDWTDVNQAASLNGMAFEIYGNPVLATEETNRENSKTKVYPNPASDKINIENINKKIKSVAIYAKDGKKILESENSQINVNSLPTGIYFISIKYDDNTTGNINFIKK